MRKLADSKWGVIGLEWRDVPCNYQVNKKAYSHYDLSPERSAPGGWPAYMDKRPWGWNNGRKML